jgi:hypothetical protein
MAHRPPQPARREKKVGKGSNVMRITRRDWLAATTGAATLLAAPALPRAQAITVRWGESCCRRTTRRC